MSAGPPPERFLVGLAVLSLLADSAEEQPLVCIVDDAQWLDRVSSQTLAFVARRLLAERVGLVFAVREHGDEGVLAGLPELLIGGLAAEHARRLLDAVIPGPLDEHVKTRILDETHGNPLALIELPRGLTPAELAGGFGIPVSWLTVRNAAPVAPTAPSPEHGCTHQRPLASARRSSRAPAARAGGLPC